MGGKNSPICYIPEQVHVEDALKKSKKTTYFKLTLLNMEKELKVAIWASGTPEQLLLHVCTTVHMCNQIGLDTNYADATMAQDAAYCKLDVANMEYTQLAKAAKRKQKNRRRRVQIWIQVSMPCHLP